MNLLRREGFTITGIVVVIITLGLMSALILNSLSNVEAKKRDEMRKQKVNAIAAALEACFSGMCNKTYPHIDELQDDSPDGWVKTQLPDLHQSQLYDFKSNKIQENTPNSHTELQYDPRTADGRQCSLYTERCTTFFVRAWLETDPQNLYSKSSQGT